MKKARGWFQTGVGLVLVLSFAVGLGGCAKCGKRTDGSCMQNTPPGCRC